MTREFARLRRDASDSTPGYWNVPVGGMCLNAFLVVRSPSDPGQVLLGKVDPAADWAHLSALGPDRLTRIGDRWVLPASQLLLHESPDEAAGRLAREMLGRALDPLPAPRVFSESYRREDTGQSDRHWDVQFVYDLRWPESRPPSSGPWRELRFVPVGTVPRAAFGRGHGDVLELVGLPPA